MDSREFDAALSDLEKRLDRLRALYEQYFRGYERVEPLIPRKDFERRLYVLRKSKPRNTALRFRFQQLLQRYTMFTTRWGRMTRQIEEGTHPLVLERLRRRKQRAVLTGKPEERSAQEDEGPSSYELNLDEDLNLDELLSEAELAEVAAAIDKPGPHRATQPARAVAAFASPASGGGSKPELRPAAPAAPTPPREHGADDDAQDTQKTGKHPGVAAMPPPRAGLLSPPAGRPPPPPVPQAKPAARPAAAQRSFGRPAGLQPPVASGPRPAQGPPSNGGDPSLGEGRVRAIYNEFVQARRANNEPDVKYETVARRIETMLPELRKKHGGRDIDFEVVVRNGRVGLKPRSNG